MRVIVYTPQVTFLAFDTGGHRAQRLELKDTTDLHEGPGKKRRKKKEKERRAERQPTSTHTHHMLHLPSQL